MSLNFLYITFFARHIIQLMPLKIIFSCPSLNSWWTLSYHLQPNCQRQHYFPARYSVHLPYISPTMGFSLLFWFCPPSPPSCNLYHPWLVSRDQSIEVDVYCGAGNKGRQPLPEEIFLQTELNTFLSMINVFFWMCLCVYALQSHWLAIYIRENFMLSVVSVCLITFMSICRPTGPCVDTSCLTLYTVYTVCVCETVCVVYCVLSCHSRSIGIQCGSLSPCCSHLCSLGDTVTHTPT